MNASGDLIDLKFHTKAYRDMAPAELSDTIIEVVKRARGQMAERVATLYQPFAPEGIDMEQVMQGKFDAGSMFRDLGVQPPPG